MKAKLVNEVLDEYSFGERQEGGRFKTPGQVDPPMVEEDDDRIDVRAVTGDKGIEDEEEVEEGVNVNAIGSGPFKIFPKDYTKKQL